MRTNVNFDGGRADALAKLAGEKRAAFGRGVVWTLIRLTGH
jgi:hypothetical protein